MTLFQFVCTALSVLGFTEYVSGSLFGIYPTRFIIKKLYNVATFIWNIFFGERGMRSMIKTLAKSMKKNPGEWQLEERGSGSNRVIIFTHSAGAKLQVGNLFTPGETTLGSHPDSTVMVPTLVGTKQMKKIMPALDVLLAGRLQLSVTKVKGKCSSCGIRRPRWSKTPTGICPFCGLTANGKHLWPSIAGKDEVFIVIDPNNPRDTFGDFTVKRKANVVKTLAANGVKLEDLVHGAKELVTLTTFRERNGLNPSMVKQEEVAKAPTGSVLTALAMAEMREREQVEAIQQAWEQRQTAGRMMAASMTPPSYPPSLGDAVAIRTNDSWFSKSDRGSRIVVTDSTPEKTSFQYTSVGSIEDIMSLTPRQFRDKFAPVNFS